jgi:hypothetical protein
MGRFLVILGIILMIVGFAAPMFTMGGLFSSLDPMLNLATDSDAREDELCEEGEHLEEEGGASVYTQGQGYAHTVVSYCVDEDGNKRDVTMDLVDSMLGDNFFGGIGDMIGQTFIFVGLGTLGIILTVIGAIMSATGKRKGMLVMNPYNASFNMQPMQPMNPSNFASQTPSNVPQNLTAQLQQLEQAFNSNLITREEYDKARQNLLNGIK